MSKLRLLRWREPGLSKWVSRAAQASLGSDKREGREGAPSQGVQAAEEAAEEQETAKSLQEELKLRPLDF